MSMLQCDGCEEIAGHGYQLCPGCVNRQGDRISELEQRVDELLDMNRVLTGCSQIPELKQQVADAEYWALTNNSNVFRSASLSVANAPHGPNRVGAFWEKLHAEREAADSTPATDPQTEPKKP